MVEVKAEQEGLNCTATDFLARKPDHWRAGLPTNKRKINDREKRNCIIHNSQSLYLYFRHEEYIPLCQVHVKDIPLHIDVGQLIIPKEINLQTDCQSRQRLQEKASDSHVQFHGPVYLSIGLEAKRDIYNTSDLDRPISVPSRPTIHGKTTSG